MGSCKNLSVEGMAKSVSGGADVLCVIVIDELGGTVLSCPSHGWICYTLVLQFFLPGFYASRRIQKNSNKTTFSYWGFVCGMTFVCVYTHTTHFHRSVNKNIIGGTMQKPFKNIETSFLVLSPLKFLGSLHDFSRQKLVDVNWKSHIHLNWPQAQSTQKQNKTKQVSKDHLLGEAFRWQNFLPRIPKSVDELKLILLTCLLLIMPVLNVFICDDRISKQNKRYPAR